MRVTPNERWNGHWRQRGSGMRIGLRACRTLREQNFGMERRMNFGMTRVARAVQRNNASSSIVWSGWGGRTRTSEWRNQKSPGQFDLAKLFSQLMVKARMSHQRIMSNFPTGRLVGKVGSEIPRERCQSSAETAAAGEAVRQANNGNPAGQPGRTRQGNADCQGASRWLSRTPETAAVIHGMGPSSERPMTDAPDHPSSDAESLEKAAQKHKAAEDQAFADKLAKRPPPNPVERAEIKKARKRTKARAQRIAMHIENRGEAGSVVC